MKIVFRIFMILLMLLKGFSKDSSSFKLFKEILFVSNYATHTITRFNPDGSNPVPWLSGPPMVYFPDGIALDSKAKKLYWTNMGSPDYGTNGSIWRANLNGTNPEVVVKTGVIGTPKQLYMDEGRHHLYTADKNPGTARVLRLDTETLELEVLLDIGRLTRGDGVILSHDKTKVFFSDEMAPGVGVMNKDIPEGMSAKNRTDVHYLYTLSPGLVAHPLDFKASSDGKLYWADISNKWGPLYKGGGIYQGSEDGLDAIQVLATFEGGQSAEPVAVELSLDEKTLYYTSWNEGRVYSKNLESGDPVIILDDEGGKTGLAVIPSKLLRLSQS